MIHMTETQLIAQRLERSDLNARAMGVLALDGALAVVFVAAKEIIPDFWLPLFVLLLPIGLSIVVTRDKPKGGPKAGPFLDQVGDLSDHEFDVALLNYCALDLEESADASAESGFWLECAMVSSL